jgi:hypothetical protein
MSFSERLARLAVFCYQRPALRWLAIPLAGAHKRHHERLFDNRVDFEKQSAERGWWWLSFADESPPEGRGFLGVAIVEGHGVASAAERAHELGINPGGAVQGTRLIGDGVPAPEFRNRLLSREDLMAADLIA